MRLSVPNLAVVDVRPGIQVLEMDGIRSVFGFAVDSTTGDFRLTNGCGSASTLYCLPRYAASSGSINGFMCACFISLRCDDILALGDCTFLRWVRTSYRTGFSVRIVTVGAKLPSC